MPTIEFHGYTAAQARALRDTIALELRKLPYAADIVFELPSERATSVEDLGGRSQPFVRIQSRSLERADELAACVAPISDVETALLSRFERKVDRNGASDAGAAADSPPLVESEIVAGIEPIRWFGLAMVLHQVFNSPLDPYLAARSIVSANEAAAATGLDAGRVNTVLSYLANEGALRRAGTNYHVEPRYRQLRACKGWYTMFVGGYAPTLEALGSCLRDAGTFAPRSSGLVGEGSCEISHYDAIPLARSLMAAGKRPYRRLLDLGCGNAVYLAELCAAFPEMSGIGVEPSAEGHAAAIELIRGRRLEHRVELVHKGAAEYLASLRRIPENERPDLSILGFVLHEILGQDGRDGVVRFLRELTAAAPRIDLVVIEVDEKSGDAGAMSHPLARNYYNLYYLLHGLTRQRLIAPRLWEEIFSDAGLTIVARDLAPSEVDSTHLEVGYLLRRAEG